MNRGASQRVELRPRAALAIGVTGHRPERLAAAAASADALGSTVQTLLTQIADRARALQEAHPEFLSDAEPELRLLSALAAGADQLAAEVAAREGWVVDVCLPFSPDQYLQDFDDDASRSTFEQLLAQARCVFALHGSRRDEVGAYEAAGRVILDQSDLLLAIWDGDPSRGRGGTAQIVAEAISQRIPVIRIDPAGTREPELMWSGLDDADLEQLLPETVPTAPAAQSLAKVVAALSAPPSDPADRASLQKFIHGAHRPRRPALSYPILLWAAGVRHLRRSHFSHAEEQGSAAGLRSVLDRVTTSPNLEQQRLGALITRYARADAAALDYSLLYRSGFVGNFALAALAVLLALGGLLLPALKTFLIFGELLVVLSILLRTRAGNRGGWHRQWLDNRELAERLRALCLTSLVGDLALRDSERRDAAAIPGWVGWYSRATGREVGLLCRRADRRYLEQVRSVALSAIEQQMAYHAAAAAQAHEMEKRLERAGEFFFGATIIACAVWLAMKLAGVSMAISGPVTATEVVTFLTGLLPAFGAALYGIRMQADFAGLAARASLTEHHLSRLAESIRRDPPTQERLSARLRRLADVTLADVERWRSTYKVKELRLPG